MKGSIFMMFPYQKQEHTPYPGIAGCGWVRHASQIQIIESLVIEFTLTVFKDMPVIFLIFELLTNQTSIKLLFLRLSTNTPIYYQ